MADDADRLTTTCPSWCVDEELYPGTQVLSPMLSHVRALAQAPGVRVHLQWTQDLRPEDDPDYFYEPPVLVVYEDAVNGDPVFLPMTAEVVAALEDAGRQARELLPLIPPMPAFENS